MHTLTDTLRQAAYTHALAAYLRRAKAALPERIEPWPFSPEFQWYREEAAEITRGDPLQ